MTFRIESLVQEELAGVLRTPGAGGASRRPRSGHDELVRVLSTQCRALAETGGVSFLVAGFGQDPWPVDVETDLAVALEQIPDVLAGLQKEGEPFQLNFYEQGIERYLTGTRQGDEVTFECMSMSSHWAADPSVEIVPLAEAESLFRELRERYAAAVERLCPWLALAPAFKRWLS